MTMLSLYLVWPTSNNGVPLAYLALLDDRMKDCCIVLVKFLVLKDCVFKVMWSWWNILPSAAFFLKIKKKFTVFKSLSLTRLGFRVYHVSH